MRYPENDINIYNNSTGLILLAKKEWQPRILGTRLGCFGTAVQNGRTFHIFHKEEIAELLPKNKARVVRIRQMTSTVWRISSEINIHLF